MKKAAVGMAMDEPTNKQKRLLKKSNRRVEKGFKPISGPSFKVGGSTSKKMQDGGYTNTTQGQTMNMSKPPMKKGGAKKPTYKTGGMVNSNAKVLADNTPGSNGVKSGVNPKVVKQNKPKGKKDFSTSNAPKGAIPKSKMGGAKKSC